MRYCLNTGSGIRVTDADRSRVLGSAYIRPLLLLGSNLSIFWSNLRIRHSQSHPFLSNYCRLLGHDVIGVQSWPLIEKITPSKIRVLPMLLTQVNQRFHCLVGTPLYPIIQKYAIKRQERKKRMLHNWLSNPYILYLFCKRKKVTRRSSWKLSQWVFNAMLKIRSRGNLAESLIFGHLCFRPNVYLPGINLWQLDNRGCWFCLPMPRSVSLPPILVL